MDSIDKLRIYQELYSKLFVYAYKILNDHHNTCDVLQKVYIYLNNKDIKSFNDEKHIENWLFWLAKSESFCFIRKNSRYVAIEEQEMNEKICESDTPLQSLCKDDLKDFFLKRLPEALNKLSPFQRKCIEMKFLEGKETKEIVKKLKSTKSSVNKTISKSKVVLKEYFSKKL